MQTNSAQIEIKEAFAAGRTRPQDRTRSAEAATSRLRHGLLMSLSMTNSAKEPGQTLRIDGCLLTLEDVERPLLEGDLDPGRD